MKHSNIGSHVVCDIKLNTYPKLKELLKKIEHSIKLSNMNVVFKKMKPFSNGGTTVVWILSESHFTLHEYPEYNYISVDCYTCGKKGNPKKAILNLIEALDVEIYKLQEIERGI